MPFRIVRNDLTKMETDAIVNTANPEPLVGSGCDFAVYAAAGRDELLRYRKEKIGPAAEGEVFLTPGFALPAGHIIHAVSPRYIDGKHGEEEKLRSCYRKSLALAAEQGFRSIAFPLISTGSFRYPREEGMRIAADEIHAFLFEHDMEVLLVVFDEQATELGKRIDPDLKAYIDRNYVQLQAGEEYGGGEFLGDAAGRGRARQGRRRNIPPQFGPLTEDLLEEAAFGRAEASQAPGPETDAGISGALGGAFETGAKAPGKRKGAGRLKDILQEPFLRKKQSKQKDAKEPDGEIPLTAGAVMPEPAPAGLPPKNSPLYDQAVLELEAKLAERLKHRSDTFSEYLMYLIKEKDLENADVYNAALVDKKVFSKIKNNRDYHPQKRTALCLCIGAHLNLDETRDLLARAGYALSPCDMTDIIFAYFIENRIYDMLEVDIRLEDYGLPCIVS